MGLGNFSKTQKTLRYVLKIFGDSEFLIFIESAFGHLNARITLEFQQNSIQFCESKANKWWKVFNFPKLNATYKAKKDQSSIRRDNFLNLLVKNRQHPKY